MAWVAAHLLLLLAAAARAIDAPRLSFAQTNSDYDDGAGGTGDKGVQAITGSPIVAGVMNERLRALTSSFAKAIGKKLDYCIKDTDKEWNAAFDFSKDTTFLTNCMKETEGDFQQRVCTAAEMKFYFNSLLDSGDNGEKNYVRPNKNCNLSSWIDGCEPGWACSVGKEQRINLQDDREIPYRALKCQTCCPGFFCPHGLTCMIPCPLGAYCPLSTLNKTTGICDPYNYQPPPGNPKHTCGAADNWADVITTDDIFCPPGFYCPSTTQKLPCSSFIAGRDQLHKPDATRRALAHQTLLLKTLRYLVHCLWLLLV